jgi:hypothetical protein
MRPVERNHEICLQWSWPKSLGDPRWRFCLAALGLVFGRSLCARRNTSKRRALRICEHRKLHFMGASLELNGGEWSFMGASRSRGRSRPPKIFRRAPTGSNGTHAARRARRPKGGGGPTAAAPKPLGASNGTLCPQVGVHEEGACDRRSGGMARASPEPT